MHVFLLSPPLPHTTLSPSPPVGLSYLAAVLKRMDIKVSALTSDSVRLNIEDTTKVIIDKQPDVLALSVSTPAFNNSVAIAKGIREAVKNIVIIAGGPHATIFPEGLIENGVDIVVRGEGEETVADLISHFRGEVELDAIDGISYKRTGKIVHKQDRALIRDLDNIPFPAWEFFPVKSYESSFKRSRYSLPMVTSRGCPGKCTFCYKGIFGRRFRIRSPENMLNEVKYLKANFDIEEFSIIDDCFTTIPERAIRFCELLSKSDVGVPWSLPAGIRVDTVSQDLLESLKDAGCYRIGLGIETGNADVMKSIKKGITLEQVEGAVSLLKEVGLEFTANFMIGNLGETLDTVNDTIRFALKIDPDYAQFTRAVPYPGSEMYTTLLNEGRIISHNWDDYDYFVADTRIFEHESLSLSEIQRKLKEAYRRFYLRPTFVRRELIKRFEKEGFRKIIKSLPFAFRRLCLSR